MRVRKPTFSSSQAIGGITRLQVIIRFRRIPASGGGFEVLNLYFFAAGKIISEASKCRKRFYYCRALTLSLRNRVFLALVPLRSTSYPFFVSQTTRSSTGHMLPCQNLGGGECWVCGDCLESVGLSLNESSSPPDLR